MSVLACSDYLNDIEAFLLGRRRKAFFFFDFFFWHYLGLGLSNPSLAGILMSQFGENSPPWVLWTVCVTQVPVLKP